MLEEAIEGEDKLLVIFSRLLIAFEYFRNGGVKLELEGKSDHVLSK